MACLPSLCFSIALHDPKDVAPANNKIIALLISAQDGATACQHVDGGEKARIAAMAKYMSPKGQVDWKAFGKALLAAVYFTSYDQNVQDNLRGSLRAVKDDKFTHEFIRGLVEDDESFNVLGQSGRHSSARRRHR